jgi:hypothetical protein
MSNESFTGKPAKSASEIRRVLETVRMGNEPKVPGAYSRELLIAGQQTQLEGVRRDTEKRRKQMVRTAGVIRSATCYRQLLLQQGGIAGGFIGLLLGLNFGIAIPIATGTFWLFAITPITMSLLGLGVGVSISRNYMMDRRRDLFGFRHCTGC